MSQKIFRQVLNTLGFPLSEKEVALVALVYGNECGEIKYTDFLRDANCLEYVINGPTTGLKSTYVPTDIDFTGVKGESALSLKIKNMLSKDRVRLLEFFQDHDILRKGYLPQQKFRSVLHSQKVCLTTEEYAALEKQYATSFDPKLTNYKQFCDDCDKIFTAKDLEKDP